MHGPVFLKPDSWRRGGVGALMALAMALRATAQFSVLVCFTRLDGVAGAALVILATALVTPFQAIAEMALRPQYVLRPDTVRLRPFLELRVLAYMCLTLFLMLVAQPISHVNPQVLLLVILVKAIDGTSDIFHAGLQRGNLLMQVVALLGFNALLTILTALAVLLLRADPKTALVSSLLISTVFLGLAIACYRKFTRARGRLPDATVSKKEIARQGIPIGFASTVTGLAAASPQYMLAWAATPAELTNFAYLMYAVVGVDLLLNGLTQTWLKGISDAGVSEGALGLLRVASRLSAATGAILLAVGLGCAFVLPDVVGAITGVEPELASWDAALLIVAFVFLPACFIYPYALNAAGRGGSVLVGSVAGAVTTVVLTVVLVPSLAITGALAGLAGGTAARALVSAGMLVRTRRLGGVRSPEPLHQGDG